MPPKVEDMDPPKRDITGLRFGRLTVIAWAGRQGPQRTGMWTCKCECKNEKIVSQGNLEGGKIVSCGCQQIENRLKTKHGFRSADTQYPYIYTAWNNMNQRCFNPNSSHYKDYGGRGIGVCDEWRHDLGRYGNDILTRIGPRPSDQHSIDRIDNEKGYSIDNVRWATPEEQVANSRIADRPIHFAGRTWITAPCEICKEPVHFYAGYPKKYCTRECYYESKRHGITKRCINCGDEFYASQSREDQECCSKYCSMIVRHSQSNGAKESTLPGKCVTCGDDVQWTPSHYRKFCSVECYHASYASNKDKS